MDKQNVAYPDNETVLSDKKKPTTDTYQEMKDSKTLF